MVEIEAIGVPRWVFGQSRYTSGRRRVVFAYPATASTT